MKVSGGSVFNCFYTLLLSVGLLSAQPVPPEKFFGFQPGADRKLFSYGQLIDYLSELDAQSPKLKMQEIGTSPMGRKMYICFISAAENLDNLDRLREINRRLALDPDMTDSEREALINAGKVFYLATLSMHSGEVAPSQAAPLITYDLITTDDPAVQEWLRNVVFMMIPNHNPDGMDMTVEHYKKYLGTKYEGSSMPGIYHKYVGHDNNRDFVVLSQSDTKAIARIYNLDWYPQVMVEKHQMGSTGPRYFVPPNHDPIAENIDAGIWNWAGLFGQNMIKDMTASGLSGISQRYLFDDYWPGSTETCIWKNVIGFLTEAASVKYATPIYVESNELKVYGKGLSEYKKSINMPLVWPGGWWRLSDIVQYEIASTLSILKTASLYHREILTFRNDICRKEVKRGQTEAPLYYVMPVAQHDRSELVSLVNLMIEHGVQVYRLTAGVSLGKHAFETGDIVIPLAQPFRPFIKEVLEKQVYPVRHYTPGGEIIKPYDITSWSLPLHKGIRAVQIDEPAGDISQNLALIAAPFVLKDPVPATYQAVLFSASENQSYQVAFQAMKRGVEVKRISTQFGETPAGSFLIRSSDDLDPILKDCLVSPNYLDRIPDIKVHDLKMPRIALVESYFHDMDAGWTRFIFDTYGIVYKVIRPGEFERTDFVKNFDIVVFPSEDKNILMEGKWKSENEYYISSYPPEYTKGIGKKGMQQLLKFIEQGGQIISWGGSSSLFDGTLELELSAEKTESYQLPFTDISEKLSKEGLYCPGSLVRIELLSDHPLTYGMPEEISVFFRGKPVYQTSLPKFDMDRRVIAGFPENDILMSGYCEKEETLAGKVAMIWLKKGKGELVLFGFNPQFRASTPVAYKLLFNAILLRQS